MKPGASSCILVTGKPGAGKSTQAKILAARSGMVHVSAGALLRDAMTPAIRASMIAGKLVPARVSIKHIEDHLARHDAGFVLEGFPRTTAHAVEFDAWLARRGTTLSCVVDLRITDDDATARILERAAASGRPDDTAAAVRRRLATYAAETAYVVDHYAAAGIKVECVDASRNADDVAADIAARLDGAPELAY